MLSSSRTFRIFVSSTFSDLKAERNALQERVFPRLRELAIAHSCRFQAIDLRWGVSEEAALDQQTMRDLPGRDRALPEGQPAAKLHRVYWATASAGDRCLTPSPRRSSSGCCLT